MAGGLAPGNPANEPDKKPVKHHSNFKPNVSNYLTALFGMLTPTYGAQAVPSDEGFSVRCNSDIDTFTLKAPLMTPVRHKKAYFYVPRKAVLPQNADLIVTNPLTGDDVVPEAVNCVVPRDILSACLEEFYYQARRPLQNMSGGTPGAGSFTLSDRLKAILRMYEVGLMFNSSASILNRLGIDTSRWFNGPDSKVLGRNYTYDETMEYLLGWIKKYFSEIVVTVRGLRDVYMDGANQPDLQFISTTYYVNMDTDVPRFGTSYISFRQLLDILREANLESVDANASTLRDEYTVNDVKFVPSPDDEAFPETNLAITFSCRLGSLSNRADFTEERNWMNLERVIAYQLAVAQWYSNDAVDAVYTTGLWHNVQRMLGIISLRCTDWWEDSILMSAEEHDFYRLSSDNWTPCGDLSYLLNGSIHQYDSVSGIVMVNALMAVFYPLIHGVNSETATGHAAGLFYWKNLLSMQRSLRFKDYFVGSRTRPLAVGDVDVQTNSEGKVSVIDITKNIMMQKFLNQVNRIHRTLKEYSRGIFGQSPMFDPTEVMFIGSTEEVIGASETENTGAGQLSEPQTITSHLRSSSSRFAFTFDVPEFGTIIAITSFDIARPYIGVTDRETFHVDRFDDFNPYLQHIGDQPVFGPEINATQASAFGYQLRYSEYKQRLDRAVGGFVGNFLPGYAAIASPETFGPLELQTEIHINSDFIRAHSYEFDQFYLALTNFSPAGYFHFIIRDDYEVNINRPMEAAPSIL